MEDILQKVRERGWTEEHARLFLKEYDEVIKKQILYHLIKLNFIKNEDELSQLGRHLHEH